MPNSTPDDLPPRLRAACDLTVPSVREYGGRHEYDGVVPDYSREAIAALVARLGRGEPLDDPHDEVHLAVFEDHLRVFYGELQAHRRNPLIHLSALDLACYDREYAPAAERAAARDRHLARWPEAMDTAVQTLDLVPAPVAEALLGSVRGLAEGIPADTEAASDAIAAQARLVAHLEHVAEHGDPDGALGADAIARLIGSADGLAVDLDQLMKQADEERDRLLAMLAEATGRVALDGEAAEARSPFDVCRALVRDHPEADGVVDAARFWTRRAVDFTRERDLVPYHDGEWRVGVAPESRRWGTAFVTLAAPGEPEGPSWYHVSPPDPDWPAEDIDEWLEIFSSTTLPSITLHEVAPGHFSHGRAMRRVASPVRQALQSSGFVEGWAHYAEELCIEEGFGGGDPRFTIGMCLEALVRVTRLACAIGVHSGAMTVDDAARRFAADTHLVGSAARSEARRALFDPGYGRYTLGKLAIRDLRSRARHGWGAQFSLRRFHSALFELGAPPLGLMDAVLERGGT
ncbi:MAG TPA: DUF885 family protein [Actinocrinis sp.]|jgi:hypothetical protein